MVRKDNSFNTNHYKTLFETLKMLPMTMNENISLYIPHVFTCFDKEYVANAFKHIGEVTTVDFVTKQHANGRQYNSVYVHFYQWYSTKVACDFYEKVMDESTQARLYHDNVWYWIVLPNHAKKHIPGERKQTLNLGNLSSISTKSVEMEEENVNNMEENIVEKMIEKKEKENKVNVDDIMEFEDTVHKEMDDLETYILNEDSHLIYIDGRYVQHLERDNLNMSEQMMEMSKQIELLKSQIESLNNK